GVLPDLHPLVEARDGGPERVCARYVDAHVPPPVLAGRAEHVATAAARPEALPVARDLERIAERSQAGQRRAVVPLSGRRAERPCRTLVAQLPPPRSSGGLVHFPVLVERSAVDVQRR